MALPEVVDREEVVSSLLLSRYTPTRSRILRLDSARHFCRALLQLSSSPINVGVRGREGLDLSKGSDREDECAQEGYDGKEAHKALSP